VRRSSKQRLRTRDAMPKPGYVGLRPASATASRIARAASRKSGTKCELALRRELRRLDLRPRLNSPLLPGKPDLVFPRARLVVFCDGDFWHGRRYAKRKPKLLAGHNGEYWVAKVASNMRRDRRNTARLRSNGWQVLRFWESIINKDPTTVASFVADAVRASEHRRTPVLNRRSHPSVTNASQTTYRRLRSAHTDVETSLDAVDA
jgi:DNA mismatch endonuclease, patch repair protein